MVTRIVIEGEMARIEETNVVQTARLSDILSGLEARPPITMFHPRSAIATHWDESALPMRQVTFLCELSPGIRSIVKSGRRFRLAMPWTYFVFKLSGTNLDRMSLDDSLVYHTNQKVMDGNSRLWAAFLPNVYSDGRICYGSTGVSPNQPLSQRIDQLVNEWYLTTFNNDLIDGRRRPFPFEPHPKSSLLPWATATREQGASAWLSFPEWDMTTGYNDEAPNWTVEEAFNSDVSRMSPMTFTEAIPAIPVPATFGRTEEWLRGLSAVQRGRLLSSLTVLQTENPALVEVTPEDTTATPTNTGPIDDGGEPA